MGNGKGKTRVSRHNGRSGKHGVYNPKHNDRSFDVENAENIRTGMTAQNRYWDWKNGLRSHEENGRFPAFTQVEKEFYEAQFGDYISGQCARNKKTGHSKRDRSIDDLLGDPRFCPEETIYQIGKEGACPPPETLLDIVTEFMKWYEGCFGANIKVLDWALHLDETSPHIHARQVFYITNRYGESEPKQEKALEQLEIPLPKPGEKTSRTNNRKVKFDEICRDTLIDICREYGLEVESEAVYGGRKYLEKQDYIIESQREKIAELERRAEEKDAQLNEQGRQLEHCLTLLQGAEKQIQEADETLERKHEELSDIDRLTDRLSDIVYNSAVEKVAAEAVKAAQAETMKQISETAAEAMKNNGSLFRNRENDFLKKWLTGAKKLIRSTAGKVTETISRMLKKPEISLTIRREISERAKPSVRETLRQYRQPLTQTDSRDRRRGKSQGDDCL